jgi:hypothetical protein
MNSVHTTLQVSRLGRTEKVWRPKQSVLAALWSVRTAPATGEGEGVASEVEIVVAPTPAALEKDVAKASGSEGKVLCPPWIPLLYLTSAIYARLRSASGNVQALPLTMDSIPT